jgi:phage-related protein
MKQPMLRVVFYTSGENKPVRDWLLKLEPKQRKEIGADIQAVQWRWPVSKPLVDGLGGGLYEVRSSIGSRAFRMFFCIQNDAMVLLYGIEKKTQKTPKQALDIARKRIKEVRQ